MRPLGSSKQRLPIYEKEFKNLITLIKAMKISKATRSKLISSYTLLYLTGCRVGEIVGLRRADLQNIIKSRSLALNSLTKTKRPRTIFFNDTMCAMISSLAEDLEDGYIFYAPNSKEPMSKFSLTELLNGYLKRTLGSLYTTHSFRAGYITRIVEATGNLKTAQDMVGHTSIKTTIRYLSTSLDQKLEALDRVFK